jgi:hypothetical protein
MAQEQTVSSLFDRLKLKPGARVPYFEALLRVHISHEIPIRSEIVAVRPHQAAGRSWEPAKQDER